MSSFYEAGYNSNLLNYLGRTFLNSSLAWWYQIGIITCGRISLYLTCFLWQDVPKFILGRMIPKWGHWHGFNILPRVFWSHPANCRLYNMWQDISQILFPWQEFPKLIFGRMIPKWVCYMWQEITQTHCLSLAGCSKIHPWRDDTKFGLLHVAGYHFT